MKVNPEMFRGYDLRGVVDKDLNPEIVEAIGKAYGTFLKRSSISKAIIAHDCRATSEEYSEAIIRGMTWAGVDTINIGLNMVGTFYWAQYYLDVRGGVFVTASHNPPEFNGFKFANDFSETLVREGMVKLCNMVLDDDYVQGETPGKTEKKDIRGAYYADIVKRLPLAKPFKVLIDPLHSTAGVIAPELLREAGCEVIERNCQIDPTFPLGTPDPTESKVAERVRDDVLEVGADIGFSYDADGDRIGIVDEKGGIIWNDVLVAIFASDVLRSHPGAKIMFNTLCSKVVVDTIKREGGEPFMWRTGHSFLKKKNQEVKAAFIGELSGHFFFSADFYNHDDGLYSTMRLLHYLAETGKTLSQVVSELPQYISSPEMKLGCADDKKAKVIDDISKQLISDYEGKAEIINDERAGDGVRLEMPDAMFVVRYSQNGPYLTIKYEAKTQDRYDELKHYLRRILSEHSDVDWSFGVNTEALD